MSETCETCGLYMSKRRCEFAERDDHVKPDPRLAAAIVILDDLRNRREEDGEWIRVATATLKLQEGRIAALTAQVAKLEGEREELCETVRALNALCDCEGTGWVAIGSKDDPEEPHEKCILPHCADARALVRRVRDAEKTAKAKTAGKRSAPYGKKREG